ncbi:MAG: class I SAM-dependent RNA methyltransferase [Candidatus Cloacimonadota bacterium]|nr:class I SAM-dependent RNA methyltransferase [Candidatus Cloacimonadota bacterium]
MFEYQKTNRYFAQIAGTLEDIGIRELKKLGATEVSKEYRGAYFSADKEALYRINYQSAILQRVLAPIAKFNCHSTKYLYKMAMKIDWTKLIDLRGTFAIFSKVNNSHIHHSKYAALKLKDAIVDQFREKYDSRPNVDTKNPDVWINLFIDKNFATINIDTSGGSLHRRKYRENAVSAPMQETLAAGMIELSGWSGKTPLYDPFCGSGTILAESLLKYSKIPPAFLRNNFGFQKLPDYDSSIFQRVINEADKNIIKPCNNLISGCDISSKAVSFAKSNMQNIKFGNLINISTKAFNQISKLENYTIITNPPFGVRMGDESQAKKTYKEFGDFLKQRCTGSTAYIYFGNRKLIGSLGLKPTWKKVLKNGPLDGRLVKVEIY